MNKLYLLIYTNIVTKYFIYIYMYIGKNQNELQVKETMSNLTKFCYHKLR